MSELNIYQRVNAVMKKIEYVQKDKKVSGGGQNYSAVTHDQVVSVVRAEMVKNGIVIYPEQLKSDMLIKRDLTKDIKMHLYSGDYAIHFCNMDKPEEKISVTVNAQAADNGDKAPGKCLTYATKMALLKLFALETGEDEESRVSGDKTITQSQLELLQPMYDALPSDRQSLFLSLYSLESLADIPLKQHAKIMAQLKKAGDVK